MAGATRRMLDDGGAFPVWAPSRDLTQPPCGHGIWIETELDGTRDTVTGTIVLLLRSAERIAGTEARVQDVPVRVALALSTGRCTPLDEQAQRFVEHSAWFDAAVIEHLDKLRERARRAAAQSDRETSFRSAFQMREQGAMMPYERLFPADWDLYLRHDGKTYWAIDNHCLNPTCTCAEIVVQIHDIEAPKAEFIGDARLDLLDRRARPKASTPLAAQVFERLWTRRRNELLRRHHEVKTRLRRLVADERAEASPSRAQVPRNAPCPCGSGKKYKRCCATSVGTPGPAARR